MFECRQLKYKTVNTVTQMEVKRRRLNKDILNQRVWEAMHFTRKDRSVCVWKTSEAFYRLYNE